MMTKRHFEAAAGIVREKRQALALPKVADKIADAFVEFFRGDNPRFDEGRFRTACEVKKVPKARAKKGAEPMPRFADASCESDCAHEVPDNYTETAAGMMVCNGCGEEIGHT